MPLGGMEYRLRAVFRYSSPCSNLIRDLSSHHHWRRLDDDRCGLGARATIHRTGSNGHTGERPRSATLEENLRLSSTGARRDRLLSVQNDHQWGATGTHIGRAPDRSLARLQHLESDDRARSLHVVQGRALEDDDREDSSFRTDVATTPTSATTTARGEACCATSTNPHRSYSPMDLPEIVH